MASLSREKGHLGTVGETGASCIQGHVVTESFYKNTVHMWSYH